MSQSRAGDSGTAVAVPETAEVHGDFRPRKCPTNFSNIGLASGQFSRRLCLTRDGDGIVRMVGLTMAFVVLVIRQLLARR